MMRGRIGGWMDGWTDGEFLSGIERWCWVMIDTFGMVGGVMFI